MRVSLVLHPAARATLNGAILRVLLLHRRGVFQHVEHAVVLIRRLRGRFSLLLLLIVAAVWLILRLRRRAILPGVFRIVFILVLVLVLVVLLLVVFFAAVLVLIFA